MNLNHCVLANDRTIIEYYKIKIYALAVDFPDKHATVYTLSQGTPISGDMTDYIS